MEAEALDLGFQELDSATLYGILSLRSAVFVVEQNSIYHDPDGIDLRATHHLLREKGTILAYARTYVDGGAWHLGRVLVRPQSRGQGLARRIVAQALARIGDVPVLIEAQTYLENFYAGFGFARRGEEYILDGIPHLPMIRSPVSRG